MNVEPDPSSPSKEASDNPKEEAKPTGSFVIGMSEEEVRIWLEVKNPSPKK